MFPYKFFLPTFVVFCVGLATGSLDKCLRDDSISCLQLQIYETAKDFFDKPNVELFSGITVSKSRGREAKSLEEIETEGRIRSAHDVMERQGAIQDYFSSELTHLWKDGSVSWDPTHTARSLINFIPNNFKTKLSTFVSEGRGKQKKQLKMLLPLLIGIKLKMAALAAITYMAIAVIAKKAVLAGLIALLISGFISIKSLIESRHRKHEEIGPYHVPWDAAMNPYMTGAAAGPAGVYDHDLASSYTNQQLAYAGQPHQLST